MNIAENNIIIMLALVKIQLFIQSFWNNYKNVQIVYKNGTRKLIFLMISIAIFQCFQSKQRTSVSVLKAFPQLF